MQLSSAIDLVSSNPAAVLGLPKATIEVGTRLTASLRRVERATHVGIALWRDGRLVFGRESRPFRIMPAAV
jgi:alpha-D-ribose 1-methylphosphonate 5-triphosphate diphosphatase